jgi:Zn-dependent protease with chaperone function
MESFKPTETKPTIRPDAPGSLTTTDQFIQEWVAPVWESVRNYLAKVPDYIGEWFAHPSNKKFLTTLALIIGSIVTVKVILAVLDAINDLPLISPLMQLIGLIYTSWFIYRYLWKASNRQELLTEIEAIRTQIFGEEPRDI